MKPEEVIAYARERGVKMVDLKFIDLPGMWQHFTIPLSELKPDVFEEGLNFDGSSIRGWRAINESDMTVKPDPKTPEAGVLSLSFTRPPYRGKLRAPIAKTGAIAMLACFWNVREPIACEAACSQLLGSMK